MKREIWVYAPGLVLCCLLIGSVDTAWSQATDPTYVGSVTCLACHNGLVAKTDMRGWQNTLHAKMYREPQPENIIADFTGSVTISDTAKSIPAVTFKFDNNGGKGPFTVSFLDSTFTVMRVQGGASFDKDEDPVAPGVAGRSKFIGKQRFQTKIGNNYYILPVQWNPVPGLDGKGKGWAQTFRPLNLADWVDTSGKFKLNKAVPEERNCAGCHETGVAPSVNAQGEIIVQAAEANIGCEACHGPGSEHIKVAVLRPADLKIVNPAKLPPDRANEVCGRCHNRGESTGKLANQTLKYPYSSDKERVFRPGDTLADFFVQAGDKWPDGTSSVNRQQWIDFQQSDHYKKANMTCFACHTAHGDGAEHGLKKTARDNSLCVQCHTNYSDVAALQAHTKHKTIDPTKGLGRCVDCHMPTVALSAVPYESHSHTFKVVSPQVTLDKKMPNSCAVSCHRDGRFGAPTFGVVDASLTKWDEASDVDLAKWLLQPPSAVATVVASDLNGDGKGDFSAYALLQNYPNPFNPETQIVYNLPEAGRVHLRVYNVVGQVVRTLVGGAQAAGHYEVRWDGRDDAGRPLTSGIYFYRIEASGFSAVRRMVLIK